MPKKILGWVGLATLFVCVSVLLLFQSVQAETLQSSSYRFDESVVGSGGMVQSSSDSYQLESSTDDLVIGNTASSNYQIDTGSKTTNDPSLSFIVNESAADFGSFSTTETATSTSTFSVLNYTSYGYVVQIIGSAPTNGAHTIESMSETAASQFGIEQFGINLVANTLPSAFGDDPDNGQFGFGEAATNYNTPNNFRYVSSEIIASAPKSSGITTYTISYIVNVDSLTPGGQYTSDQTLIITGTY